MKKPTRQQVLAWIRYHASKGDIGAAQRLYIENRISWQQYQRELMHGMAGETAECK
jgi:hypothetical protein